MVVALGWLGRSGSTRNGGDLTTDGCFVVWCGVCSVAPTEIGWDYPACARPPWGLFALGKDDE